MRKGTSPQSLTAIASLVDAAAIGAAGRRQRGRLGRAPHAGARAWLQGPHCRRQGQRHRPRGRDRSGQRGRRLDRSAIVPPAIVPDEPSGENSASGILGGEVYAGPAYDALAVEKAIEAAGGTSKLLRKDRRRLPAERLEAHNRPLRPLRGRIEKIFGTWKRTCRFRCMRWIGLSKAKLQVRPAAIASDVERHGACEPPE